MTGFPDRYTSIVIASHLPSELRLQMFRTSMDSLFETTVGYPVEIILVDNGGTYAVPPCIEAPKVACYIRNYDNMSFGFARNQGIACAKGNYIVIADNDIVYHKGWLEALWAPLEAYPRKKIYSTPIEYPTGFLKEKYDQGKLDVNGVEYNLNMRAGSNCFMIRRKDLDTIGHFTAHRVAGTKWTDKAVGMKYLAAVAPKGYATDIGLREGYRHHVPVPIGRTLRDGTKVLFNQDEYKTS